nr:hypothetical protein [Pseudomonas mendocina]
MGRFRNGDAAPGCVGVERRIAEKLPGSEFEAVPGEGCDASLDGGGTDRLRGASEGGV